MRSVLAAALLLAAPLAFLATPASAQTASWTILVYMDADNNLEDVGIEDYLEMASVGSTEEVNIVVQFDRAVGGNDVYNWHDTWRFRVERDKPPTTPNALPIPLGEVNMADPKNLTDFVTWGIATYPARHYFLVLWDHGDGWQGVVVDDDPVPGDTLTAQELRTSLADITSATGRRIDILGNDACRMSLEIQYELVDYVDYFVGSEKDEPLSGWPYDTFLGDLVANPSQTPEQVGEALVDRYIERYEDKSLYSVTLGLVSASLLRPFATAFDTFLGELEAHQPYFTEDVLSAREATEHYEIGGIAGGLEYDLYHFVENVLTRIPSRRLERPGVALLDAIDRAVLYERHWDNPEAVNGVPAANAHGLSIWFPAVGGDPRYESLALSRDTRWDDFLRTYSIGVPPQVPMNTTAATEDADGDGHRETLNLTARPSVSGTIAVDVYRDGAHAFSFSYAAVGNRTETFRMSLAVGGVHEVTYYLLVGDKVVNLALYGSLVVEEIVTFRGRVLDANGGPVDGALVALVNGRTGERLETVARGGAYALEAVYPTWFAAGDPLTLRAESGGVSTSVSFDAEFDGDRTFDQDLHLNVVDLAPWIAALVIVAALGAAGTLYFWWRLRRFRVPPT